LRVDFYWEIAGVLLSAAVFSVLALKSAVS
jgi:hypothetical protein